MSFRMSLSSRPDSIHIRQARVNNKPVTKTENEQFVSISSSSSSSSQKVEQQNSGSRLMQLQKRGTIVDSDWQ